MRDINFVGCDECDGCLGNGARTKNVDLDDIFHSILDSTYVVVSFPVYFLGPPSLAKAFIDRAQYLWVRRFILKDLKYSEKSPVGCLLSCGGFPGSNRIFNCNIAIIKAFYNACAVRYHGELVFGGVDSSDDLLNIERLDEIIREFAEGFLTSSDIRK